MSHNHDNDKTFIEAVGSNPFQAGVDLYKEVTAETGRLSPTEFALAVHDVLHGVMQEAQQVAITGSDEDVDALFHACNEYHRGLLYAYAEDHPALDIPDTVPDEWL